MNHAKRLRRVRGWWRMIRGFSVVPNVRRDTTRLKLVKS